MTKLKYTNVDNLSIKILQIEFIPIYTHEFEVWVKENNYRLMTNVKAWTPFGNVYAGGIIATFEDGHQMLVDSKEVVVMPGVEGDICAGTLILREK